MTGPSRFAMLVLGLSLSICPTAHLYAAELPKEPATSTTPKSTGGPEIVAEPEVEPPPAEAIFPALESVGAPEPVPLVESTPVLAPAVVEPAVRNEARFTPTAVYLERVLNEDTVWRGVLLVEGPLTVAPQATLTIEPGTLVRFRHKGAQTPLLLVQGRIVAQGTAEAPIIFTSSFAVPAAADWQGVMLVGSEKKNILENCRIEGAQTGIEGLFSSVTLKNVMVDRARTGFRFQDTLVVMDGGGALNCDTGLGFTESEATLRAVSAQGNLQGVSAKRSSVFLSDADLSGNQSAFIGDNCRVKIQGGGVLGNGTGVTLTACEGSVTDVRIASNQAYGMSLASSRVRLNANQITGNGNNGLVVQDGAAVAWGNAIYQNSGYDLYNAGTEEFRAPGNWWGTAPPRIFDNEGRSRVSYAPVLGARPLTP